jgi:hypothetical protein
LRQERQIEKADAIGITPADVLSNRHGDRGLADTTRPNHGYETLLLQLLGERVNYI